MNRNPHVPGLLIVVLLAVACEAAPDAGGAVERVDTAAADDARPAEPAAAEATMRPEPDSGRLELAPIDHSGVTGTVQTDRGDGEVTLTVALAGLQAGVDYTAHVHDGRCAAGGPVRLPMGPVEVGEGGRGATRLTAAAAQLPEDEPLFVQVHGTGGAAVACADLSGPESAAPRLDADSAGD